MNYEWIRLVAIYHVGPATEHWSHSYMFELKL